jgi:hypothetical protein
MSATSCAASASDTARRWLPSSPALTGVHAGGAAAKRGLAPP